MIKQLLFYAFFFIIVACGSTQHVVRTTPTTPAKKPITRTVRKPIKANTKPVVSNTNNDKTSTIESTSNVNTPPDSTEILEATTAVKVTTAMVQDYIEKYKAISKKDMVDYGIPASITLGQGILESGAGTGPLSVQANNHFGIKCHKEWNGPSVRYDDDEANECFRKYASPEESFRDHSLFLSSRAHYSSLFQLDKSDYRAWAMGLKNAGYATDPAYPTKLIGLIERYQLQKFDAEVLGTTYTSTSSGNTTPSQLHQVSKGDTLYSISKRYNISIEDLKKKNNMANDSLSVGQNLIIK
ncbi:glucosaminidase domain-containing protein [Flavobacterium aciduliphilum]|uniref:Peptidoglycan hydrolase n=1 Tax=Flavobacterium aciduliphilum TaxID=1101402 RepID=A0A328YUJ0_9FLAO|nr:glucosaminidase domain-containing protein [Flavobacterium aciduliphilum]RAR74217.1 flagellum-specific peptidoglycan hydrolase FlgJ [Flavobacterium aciduliphilum]